MKAPSFTKTCKNYRCENTLFAPEYKLYCSTVCRNAHNRHEYKIRNQSQWTQYARDARQVKKIRNLYDKDTCLVCDKIQPIMHLHHLIKTKDGGKNSVSNLIRLCSSCHALWHRQISTRIDALLSN